MTVELSPENAAGTLRPGDIAVIQSVPHRVIAVEDDHFWGADPKEPRQTIKMHYDLLEDGPSEYLPREHREEIGRRLEELEEENTLDAVTDDVQEEDVDDDTELYPGVDELRENVEAGTIEDVRWVWEAIEETDDLELLRDARDLTREGSDLWAHLDERVLAVEEAADDG